MFKISKREQERMDIFHQKLEQYVTDESAWIIQSLFTSANRQKTHLLRVFCNNKNTKLKEQSAIPKI